jgi:flagellar biosynthesis chaperone FliJ
MEMKFKELENEAKQELKEEKKEYAKSKLKECIEEITALEQTLAKLKTQYEELLEKDISDDFYLETE